MCFLVLHWGFNNGNGEMSILKFYVLSNLDKFLRRPTLGP